MKGERQGLHELQDIWALRSSCVLEIRVQFQPELLPTKAKEKKWSLSRFGV